MHNIYMLIYIYAYIYGYVYINMIYECRSCSTYPNRNGDGQQGEGGTSLEVYSMIASHDEYHYNGCIHNWQLETHTVEQEDIIYHIQIYTIYIYTYIYTGTASFNNNKTCSGKPVAPEDMTTKTRNFRAHPSSATNDGQGLPKRMAGFLQQKKCQS